MLPECTTSLKGGVNPLKAQLPVPVSTLCITQRRLVVSIQQSEGKEWILGGIQTDAALA